ncbi:AraC family transcriptional regulator [Mycobacterium paragordonae]|uniref:Helix-turn-helix domain-containing protein n=1 Tax=Mycobacterium paragordonae TaxID=1389713 RepID=A0A4R5WV53_9MYCO|nr:helix-turn-helix domain-containing protein [Mycobacterium paragordonae]MDP7733180.1 helix-turn-helix domain-containing protein [Mycobacterium paragordonae]TDK98040.1 AraC family transcriptional regulator [Mycobacterium paragordonae]TDL08752.1 AraC family transcriptional regulator [Mycobacterium paragordonae]
MSTVLFDTGDLNEVEEAVSASYSHVRLVRPADETSMHARIARSQLCSTPVDDVSFGLDVTYQMEPLDTILLGRIYSGAMSVDQPGLEPRVFGPGEVTAAGAIEALPMFGNVSYCHYVLVSIARSAFDEVAANPAPRDGTAVRLTANAVATPEGNRFLVRAVDHVCTDVVANSQVAQSILIVSAVRRYLAACMLATFPNTAVFEPTIEDRHDSTPLLLRRAMTFIDDNAHRDISLADIARAACITPRALQYMFRRHRYCTPTEYLRQVRLHHAHLELLRASSETSTVSAVAARWGFAHLGRFAAFYRQEYGESPQATLRR